MSELPGYMTAAEAAAELGLSSRRIRQLADELKAIRVGQVRLFPVAAIRAAKKAGRPKPGPKSKKTRS